MKKKIITKNISGWGNYPNLSAQVVSPQSIDELANYMLNEENTFLARGGKTSYGDASLNGNGLNIDMKYFPEVT